MAKKKKEKYLSFTEKGIRYLQCKKCGGYQSVSNKMVVSSICSKCLSGMIPIEKPKSQYIVTGRPAGWHWMKEFVDKDGNVYHKGKEVPELKGTLSPTKIKKIAKKKRKTKKSYEEKINILAKEYKKKQKLKKERKRDTNK